MPRCECCWKDTDEMMCYGYLGLCPECYERTVQTVEELCRILLYDNESEWRGTYLLDDGRRLTCHDCLQYDEGDWEWETEEGRVVGSVYYEIINDKGKEEDGGEYGYTRTTTFGGFISFVEEANAVSIIQKISDEEERL